MNISFEEFLDAIPFVLSDTLKGIKKDLSIISKMTKLQRKKLSYILCDELHRNLWFMYLQNNNSEKLLELVEKQIEYNENWINQLFSCKNIR